MFHKKAMNVARRSSINIVVVQVLQSRSNLSHVKLWILVRNTFAYKLHLHDILYEKFSATF